MRDLNALESFVIASETLNFSLAAARRNTVQSAISAHIRKLEAELGCLLFSRGRGRAMALTPEGTAFAVYARRILGLSDEAVKAIRGARGRRTIRLGTTVTLAMSVVARALSRYAAVAPDVQIQIQCDRSDALLALMDAGEIDLAFMMDQGRRPGREFVESTTLVWVAGPGLDPRAITGDVPLVFLTDGRDLRGYAFDALDQAGRTGFLAHLSPHPIGVRSILQAGLALTVMPQVAVEPPIRALDAALGLPALKSVALSLYRSADAAGADSAQFADLLREQMPRPG